ncbi:MAG: hypothetical protein WCQ48_06380 [Chloroflexota bacterium]
MAIEAQAVAVIGRAGQRPRVRQVGLRVREVRQLLDLPREVVQPDPLAVTRRRRRATR